MSDGRPVQRVLKENEPNLIRGNGRDYFVYALWKSKTKAWKSASIFLWGV